MAVLGDDWLHRTRSIGAATKWLLRVLYLVAPRFAEAPIRLKGGER
jgi:hypothetical protein